MTVPFITVPAFTAALPKGVNYGFFTREGGVSTGHLRSLNVGYGTQDQPENVAENRRRITETLQADHLFNLYQTHSAETRTIDCLMDDTATRPEGDGLVTAVPGQAVGVLTADCVPVLFAGLNGSQPLVGAAHAGWGGTFKGIIAATIDHLRRSGADNIVACIGPCIRQPSYEVGDEFRERFVAQDRRWQHAFAAGRQEGKWQFDLPFIVRAQLEDAGVKAFDCGIDTYPDTARFFSYRRATHEQAADYGRQISAIVVARV